MRNLSGKEVFASVLPLLKNLESFRIRSRASYRRRLALALVAVPLFLPCVFVMDMQMNSNPEDNGQLACIVSVLCAVPFYIWVTRPKRDYTNAYKTGALPEMAKLLGLDYEAQGKIPIESLDRHKILPPYSGYKAEDLFRTEFHGAVIRFSEIRLLSGSSARHRSSADDYFRGIAILIDLPVKKFTGHTIVVNEGNAFMKWVLKSATGLKRADLVDVDFERQFDAYTSDQVEARYIMHPHMIEKLKDMRRGLRTSTLMASFMGDSILLMLSSNRNFFEPDKIDVIAINPRNVMMLKKELSWIYDIVEQIEFVGK